MRSLQILIISALISISAIFGYSQSPEKTLLVFGAKWCKYCDTAKNDMKSNPKLAESLKRYAIIDLDYDNDKDVINGHNVKVLPTFIIYHEGREMKRLSGYKNPRELARFLE